MSITVAPLSDQNSSSWSVGSLLNVAGSVLSVSATILSRMSRICAPVLPLRSREIMISRDMCLSEIEVNIEQFSDLPRSYSKCYK